MDNIAIVWQRLRTLSGEQFHTVRGIPFAYEWTPTALRLTNTNRDIPAGDVAEALARWPVSTTTSFQDLQGPSYLFAILLDPRVGVERRR